MKKYFKILEYEIKSAFSYISNVFYEYIGFLIHIFIFLNLWKYIYSDPSSLISGYSLKEMIWYVIITEILWSALGGRRLVKDISTSRTCTCKTYYIFYFRHYYRICIFR